MGWDGMGGLLEATRRGTEDSNRRLVKGKDEGGHAGGWQGLGRGRGSGKGKEA